MRDVLWENEYKNLTHMVPIYRIQNEFLIGLSYRTTTPVTNHIWPRVIHVGLHEISFFSLEGQFAMWHANAVAV
ncbi:hypothetical protein TSUD_302050 [Trifolium subterraneum]|uniref:Uncharacterized protein n=1 Tax=Trifolium subterraneum TaxID=3900 RepID=A0A2Z6P397_TRISU|nr:hypothetical protein TSUD_302050 [Trifolium subterraneum]